MGAEVMLLGGLLIPGVHHDEIFDLNSPLNRDDGLETWLMLKKRFLAEGACLHTVDMNADKFQDFVIHMDVAAADDSSNSYLLMLETPQVRPDNGRVENWTRYRKIFTWNDDLVDGNKFLKINFPNIIQTNEPDGFTSRELFCCLIAGNKTLSVCDARDLYIERIRTIRWFEKHAPKDFALYGSGWNIPAAKKGWVGKIERKFWIAIDRFIPLNSFPSYRGRVEYKHDVLTHTRFAICYENVKDLPGYITEKIFDCFFSGCVPVYWGAGNIEHYIPADCFIDRRKFDGMADLHHFLKEMSEADFIGYQQRIAGFLQSDAAYPFGSEFFADTIVNTIVQDLGRQA
jgi:hypothetical protein